MSVIPSSTSTTPLLQAQHASSSRYLATDDRAPSPLPHHHHQRRVHSFSPNRRRRRPSPPVRPFSALISLCFFTALVFVAWDVSSYGHCYFGSICRALGSDGMRNEEVWYRNAGPVAPYRARGEGGGKSGLPKGCVIDQVNILHRHTARYPTETVQQCLQTGLNKLANRAILVPRRHAEFAFLSKADMNMTGWKIGELVDQGRKGAWRSGRDIISRYHALAAAPNAIFSRSAGGARVVEAGQYWLQGALGDSFKMERSSSLPRLDLIIPEGPDSNNTLSVNTCPAYSNASPPTGDLQANQLKPLIEPIAERLNFILRPEPPLDVTDVICLSEMCGYDSQIEGEDWEAWSRWCGIFTRSEWEVLGYYRDVQGYYSVGQGSIYGKTMGAGWINELIARQTDSAPKDSTSSNRTLNADPKAFPRGGKRIFADFTHDGEMIQVITAMNIYPQHRNLDYHDLPRKRSYITSSLIPFGAHLIVERIGCDLAGWEPDPNGGQGRREKDQKKDYVRIFLNDKLLQVNDINCEQSGFVEHGMCEVELFLEAQKWATEEVDWSICAM